MPAPFTAPKHRRDLQEQVQVLVQALQGVWEEQLQLEHLRELRAEGL